MALLEAVVSPQNHRRNRPCCSCSSCGTSCVLCGYGISVGIAGEVQGTIKRGVVVQDDDEQLLALAAPPRGSGCCAWADVADGAASSWVGPVPSMLRTTPSARQPAHEAAARTRRLRRRRGTYTKAAARSVAEAETCRLNHIAVERNRRRLMNEYLAALRGLMPPSYARRGDQASIVGGAINFVKELEHHLQSLQAQKRHRAADAAAGHGSERFPGFFTSPQYSTTAAAANSVDDLVGSSSGAISGATNRRATRRGVADVEAAVSESHATVKVLAPWRPAGQQLLPRMLLELQRRGLPAVHLNVTTTADRMVFYTFSLRMGEGCQLSSADDVADAVHDIVAAGMDDVAEQRAV